MFSFSKLARLFVSHQFQVNQRKTFRNVPYMKYYSSFATSEVLPDTKKSPGASEELRSPENCTDIESNDTETSSSIEKPIFKKGRNPFQDIEQDDKDTEVSHFIDDIAPPIPISFNLAAYANRSPTLQKLVELKVDLSKIEEKPERAKYIMQLDFETDVKPYIQFLHDKGVPTEELGRFFTKNPFIFKHDLDHLQVRINYLQSKKFNDASIARIISKTPYFLSMDTKSVDKRLGFLQKTFRLTGDEIRFVITKNSELVTYDHEKFLEKLFTIKEEMGFTNSEMKQLLLMKPKVWMLGRKSLTKRFNVVHKQMGISHEQILTFPGILLKREFLLEQRHKYLVKLRRAEYDPTKPGYIPLHDIATTTDYAFCTKCTKTSVAEYNDFLKTL